MLRRVVLHGEMAERFGPEYMLDVSSLKEAAQALGAQLDGFRDYIIANTFKVVASRSDKGEASNLQLGEQQIDFKLGRRDEIHIVPVTQGAKRRGLGKLIAGVMIAVFAWYVAPALAPGAGGAVTIAGMSTARVAMFGVALALSGASQLLAPKQKKQAKPSTEERASFVFNGAVNTTEQGECVPLIYGRCMVGSTVISAGMSTDDIPV